MSTSLSKQALPRLSDAQRIQLIEKACTTGKSSPLGAIVSQLSSVQKEIIRLQAQLETLERPDGDRVIARMVKQRLEEGKAIGFDLLKKALTSEAYGKNDAYLRLIVAEQAHAFNGTASAIASQLQKRALDELLQMPA